MPWNWIFEEFSQEEINIYSRPKAIILIEIDNDFYAITFGHSYYHINLCADKNWSFSFAQRIDYSSIKSLEVNIPNSIINKRINSYFDYSSLDLESGESLARIDIMLNMDSRIESILKDRVNIGNSLKLNICNNNLSDVAYSIDYINYIIDNNEIINKIPRFARIYDNNRINELNMFFETEILSNFENNNMYNIDFNHYICGTNLILEDFDEFRFSFEDLEESFDFLKIEEVCSFIIKNNITENILENFKISFVDSDLNDIPFKDLVILDYYSEDVILIDGYWYEYNEDYLEYLKESMNELDIIYETKYSFYSDDYFNFIKEKYKEDNELEITCSRDDFFNQDYEVIKKYFIEDNFNKFLETKGFCNYDKDTENYEGNKVEIADLYKEDTIYAVKIGGSASELSYVVDQSLIGLNFIHKNKTEKINRNNLKNVCIWLILTRNTKIDSLNDLNIIILKNKLDYWKKKVKSLNYTPIIRINYKSNNKNI